jgi:hypothetical protein
MQIRGLVLNEEKRLAGGPTVLLMEPRPALDAGCSVGRITFEMASRSSWAVRCDLLRIGLGF